MVSLSKNLAFILCLVFVISSLSLTTLEPASAETTTPSPTLLPIPSVPEFSIAIEDSSYTVPVTYSFDPSTGQDVANTSYYSGRVDALNVTITIKNQPLALSVKSDKVTGVKYFIELKPHNSANWTSLTWSLNGFGLYQSGLGFPPSNSSLTTLIFQFSNPYFPVNHWREYPENSTGLTYATNPFFPVTVAKGEPVDFRVRAGIGDFSFLSMGQLMFKGNYGDWNQLTIIMASGETSLSTSTPNPTLTPSVPEISWQAILPIMISFFSLAIVTKILYLKHDELRDESERID